MEIMNWLASFSAEEVVNLSSFIVLIAIVAYFTVFHVDDNEIAMRNLFDFYGGVVVGPTFRMKLPGSEITRHSSASRKKTAIKDREFTLDSKSGEPGFRIIATLSFILGLKQNVDKEGFKTFHRLQESLEEDIALEYLIELIDNEVRTGMVPPNEPRDTQAQGVIMKSVVEPRDIQDAITQSVKNQLQEYLDAVTANSTEIRGFKLKLDLDEAARVQMEATKLQDLKNMTAEKIATQLISIVSGLMKINGMSSSEALMTASRTLGVDIGLDKQILHIQGLENLKGIELLNKDTVNALKNLINPSKAKGGKK
ncbi:MAG: hypothetical protein AAB614_00505 [Patescibacteria group bacterium]